MSDYCSVGNVGAHDRLFGILDRVATLNRKGMEVLEQLDSESLKQKQEESKEAVDHFQYDSLAEYSLESCRVDS